MEHRDRRTEWFVPAFGPIKFRMFTGLLFLPYTGMVLAYTVIGATLAQTIYWNRVISLLVIYFLALGVGAHALDALGSKNIKPWGETFSPRQLRSLAAASLALAFAIGAYYMVRYSPLLWPVALAEGFFVLAYNLEWFSGKFHTDVWFAFSWGTLPVLAGYILQTNRVSIAAILVAAAMGLFSLIEIKISRPYKALKRGMAADGNAALLARFELILKSISFGVIALGAGLLSARWTS